MNNKKVSVIIPCYNVARYLPQCFMSLVQQTIGIENIELIFINDASTDDGATWELLCEMERAYPEHIMVIDLKENMRQGGARNIALEYVSGEYLCFVDADDWVELTFLEKVYNKAKENDADIVQFGHKKYVDGYGFIEEAGEKYSTEIIIVNTSEERRRLLFSERFNYGCCSKLYRTSMVQEAGVKFAEHVVYEEPLFVYPLFFYGKKFVLMEEQFYIYRRNLNGTMCADMKEYHTLLQHSDVQLKVWEFMKQTSFMEEYREEIAFYFFHSYLYETLHFAANRNMQILIEDFEVLKNTIKRELGEPVRNEYFVNFPEQRKLADILTTELGQKELDVYIASYK